MHTVANCFNFAEAQRLKIALDANGIDSFIPDENVAVAAPYMFATKSGVRLQVAEEDVERAEEVIKQMREQDDSADGEEPSG